MNIAEQITQLKQDFDEVKRAGYDKGFIDGQAQGGGGTCNCTWKDTFKEFLAYKNGQLVSLFQGSTFETFSFKDYNDTETAKNATNMFTGNKKLKTVTPFNTSNVTAMGTMFNECDAFTEFKGFDTKKCTIFYRMFNLCINLKSVEIDFSSATNLNETFRRCDVLEDVEISGMITTPISFADSPDLTEDSIDNIVEHLGTVETATITINSGIDMTAYEDRIRAKGWTLVQ